MLGIHQFYPYKNAYHPIPFGWRRVRLSDLVARLERA
jgi:hypothetical protein